MLPSVIGMVMTGTREVQQIPYSIRTVMYVDKAMGECYTYSCSELNQVKSFEERYTLQSQ